MNSYSLKKRAAFISLAIGLLMFAGKLSAYFITGSSAIFSDALESIVHIFATGIALFSVYISSKPADETHFYGHGNIEYFSAGIEGLLILIASLTITYESVSAFFTGIHLNQLDIGIVIITSAGLINLILGIYLIRIGKETNSLILIADGKHILTDSITSLGVILGLFFVMITGIKEIDPIFAILIALNILFTGFKLIRESIAGLMNETDKKILDSIVKILINSRRNYWIDIHQLRFWKSANKIFLDFHLILPFYFTVKQSHQEEEYITNKLKEVLSDAEIKIHFDYCWNDLCNLCKTESCQFREASYSNEFVWNKEKLVGKTILPFPEKLK
jgi:cation diffusion facilitator family transporter